MILFPNAKINIGLRVIKKRKDGFHEIETTFIPIGLCDILEFLPTKNKSTTISISGIELDGNPEDNLVVRAWELMAERYQVPHLNIHLHKVIPVGAGLGGGSADAAFMLKGINEVFNCDCSEKDLEEMASELGSDCAFFIKNTAAIGTGRGDILETINFDLSAYELLLVNPGIHVGTQEAYSGIKPTLTDSALIKLIREPIKYWQGCVVNDFEKSVFPQYPKIGELKQKILELGASYTAMSGSGSTVFGLFKKGELEGKELNFEKDFTFVGSMK